MAGTRVAGRRVPAGAEGAGPEFSDRRHPRRRLWRDLARPGFLQRRRDPGEGRESARDSPRPARRSRRHAQPLHRSGSERPRRRQPVPAQRQSAARAEVRIQAQVVSAADRACAGAVLVRQAGRAVRRLQRRADGLRHLRSEGLAQGCAAAAGIARCVPAAARARMGRRPAQMPPGRAHLYVLGFLPQSLAAQCRAAHRPHAAQRDARAASGRLQRALVGARAGEGERSRSCLRGALVGRASARSDVPLMPRRIEDYAMIGDCETAALVGCDGSIDWLCWPRFDSDACFAALLGTPEHGRWLLAPKAADAKVTRRYRDHTLILETRFESAEGRVCVIDFMPPRDHSSDLVRIVVGERGKVAMHTELVLRFGYGVAVPWVTHIAPDAWRAIAGPDMVVLRTPAPMHGENMKSVADFVINEGEAVPFVLRYAPSHLPDVKFADAQQ